MIIQCEGCASKYYLPESKAPREPLRVRCPQCRAVFTLAASTERVAAAPRRREAASPTLSQAEPAPPPSTRKKTRSKPAKPKGKAGGGGGKKDRAKRLARVLVSDILIYHREKRDKALADGNLMTVMGDEIKKSWELYKEKIGAEVANSTNYFKEALNEILADGQEIF